MSVLPLRFDNSVPSDKVGLSYSFNPVTTMTITENSKLPFYQTNQIPAISIDTPSTNASIALTLDGITLLYIIEKIHISSNRPTLKDNTYTTNKYAVVVEGYSNIDTLRKKVLIFIPIDPDGSTLLVNNSLSAFNSIFLFLQNNTGQVIENDDLTKTISDIDFNINELIPNESFYIYEKSDNNSSSVNYKVIFFEKSTLFTTSQSLAYFTSRFNKNTEQIRYKSASHVPEIATDDFVLTQSSSRPSEKTSLTTTIEDSIYIDCQPVDVPSETSTNYFQKTAVFDEFMQMGLIYMITIIALCIIVYCIYNFNNMYKFFTGKKATQGPGNIGAV